MAMEALRIAAKESKIMKFVIGAFVLLAVGGLVFTDVSGYFTGGGANSTTVAKVNGTKIDIRDFDSELQSFLRRANISPEEAYDNGITAAILNGKINNILQIQAAEDLGLKIDNKTIGQEIRKIFPDATREQIEMNIRAQGMTEKQMSNSIQTNLVSEIVSTMPKAISNYVPTFVETTLNKIASERRSGTNYTIPMKSIVTDTSLTDADLMDYYTSNQQQYIVAEERAFSIGKLGLDDVKKSLPAVTTEQMQEYYDDNVDQFTVPEKRLIAQVMAKDADEAQAIYEEALKNKNLKAALKTVKDTDKGYIDAAEYEENGLPPSLSEKAFDAQISENDITPPVKTLVGYVIMQIESITPERIREFNDVQDDLKTTLAQTQLYDTLYNKMIDTEDMIDNGKGYDDIAKETGLTTNQTKFYSRENIVSVDGDLKTVLEASPSIVDEIFTLSDNGATYPLETDDNTYYLIGVSEIKPQTTIPFADVKKDIAKTVAAQKTQAMADVKMNEILSALKDGSRNVKSLSARYKATAKPFKAIARDSDRNDKDIIFNTTINDYGYQILDNNAVIIAVENITYDAKQSDTESQQSEVREQQAQVIDSLITHYNRENASITVNDRLLESTYGNTSAE